MREFKAEDEFMIPNRGKVFNVKSPQRIPIDEITNRPVKIDGKVYFCRGIEMHAIVRSDNCIREGELIGLLVKEPEGEINERI